MEAQTPPSTGWYDFLGWLDVNKKRVTTGALVVAGVSLVVGIVTWRGSEREIEAAQAMSAIRLPFNPSEPPAPGTAEAFVKLADQYPKTAAAPQATLRAASLYYGEGQWDKAQQQFQKLLANYGDTAWVPQAQLGLAACLDAQGKNAEAIAKYNDFLKFSSDPAADMARLNLARVYERANQPALAVDLLSKMTNVMAMGQSGGEVQERLKALYARHPNLAPQPAPRVPPMSPPSALLPTNIMRIITNQAAATNAAAPKVVLPPPGQPAAK